MEKSFGVGNGRCEGNAVFAASPAIKTYAHYHRVNNKNNNGKLRLPQQQQLSVNTAVAADGNSSPKLAATFQGMSVNVQPSASRGAHSRPRQDEQTTTTTTTAEAISGARARANASAGSAPVAIAIKNNNKLNNNNIVKIQKRPAVLAVAEQYATNATNSRTKPRNKSDEAINDLLQRIPDIAQIFDVQSRIGNGTFSTVLLATLKREAQLPDNMRQKFAIKHHIPTSHPDRIMKELQCMTDIGGTDNVVGIHCCLRCEASAAFVMPYMPHDRFHDFYTKMEVPEIRLYMRNLLLALRHVHKFNIIHRDVKPSNFLYNRRQGQFLLVDFGLAQHVNLSAGAAAGQHQQQQLQLAGVSNSKRPRERDSHAAGQLQHPHQLQQHAQQQQQQQQQQLPSEATLGGAVKRMRLIEEPATTVSNWNKMPLKPVNEIAQSVKPVEQITTLPTTAKQQNPPELVEAMSGTQQLATEAQQAEPAAAGPAGAGAATGSATRAGAAAGAGNGPGASTTNKYNTNRAAGGGNGAKCFCFANPSVCINCLTKKEVHASRAGTPGYRPPEVLLKYADQTTAVDVWAAGVIFLSILSSVYPFFKAPNDFVALAEIVTIFGDRAIRKTALALERMVTLSHRSKPLNLRKLCLRFRHRLIFSDKELVRKHESPDGRIDVCKNCDQYYFNCLCEDSSYVTEPLEPYECFPASAYDLLGRLLEINPHNRITAEQALNHPFFTEQPVAAAAAATATTATTATTTAAAAVTPSAASAAAVGGGGGAAAAASTATRRRAIKSAAAQRTTAPAAAGPHHNSAAVNAEQQTLYKL